MTQQNTSFLQQTSIKSAVQPNWFKECQAFLQRALLVRDNSSSMYGKKAKLATKASNDLIKELANPVNKDAFHCAVIDFTCSANITHPFTKASKLLGNVEAIKPHSGTNIALALDKAYELVTQPSPLDDGSEYERPIAVLFSDGLCADATKSANRLKEKCELVTIAFGGDADETMLKNIATSPKHFFQCANVQEIRKLFMAIGKTMTQSLSSGVSIIDQLGSL